MKNILLALVLLATPTFAIGDHFVDANLGDDTTGAGTIAAPWKTISHALAQFHATGEVVHIAAGTYDAALGESFPMDLRPGISLVGAGMQSTTIDGGSASAVIEFLAVPFSVSAASSDSVIENLHIAGLRNGIRISNDFSVGILFVPNPTLRNLKVSAQNRAVSIFGGTKAFTTIVGCEIGPSKIGIHATFFDGFGDIEVTDTKILNCETGYRVSADSGDPFATVATYIRRCEILGCTNGVQLTASNINVPVYIEDSLIADGVNGIVAPPPGGGFGGAYISRTTITGNSNYGVTTNDWENIGYQIMNSIVWGNQAGDFWLPPSGSYGVYNPFFSNIGIANVGGPNLEVPPEFVNPAIGDYRLKSTSPCIDAGYPSAVLGGVDMGGDPRYLDGSNSGIFRLDMGFDEFNPVHVDLVGAPNLGSTITLTTTAPTGYFAVTFASRAQADLLSSLYGNILIDPNFAIQLGAGFTPSALMLTIPTFPALARQTYSVQSVAFDPSTFQGSVSNRVDLHLN